MIDEKATFEQFGYYSTDLKPKSDKKIVAVCDDCGKVRIFRKRNYHARCRSCANKGKNNPSWKGGEVMRICEQCGVQFPVKSSDIKRGGGKFCSPKCQHKYQRGENHSLWKGGKIKRICQVCGAVRYFKPCDIKRGRGRFCSPECYGEWLSKHQRGENNANWKNGASYEPYCLKFNDEFKEDIRDKFGRLCFLCDKTEEENGRKLSVHHVNGNKNCGCDGDKTCQFVPLCVSCHGKMLSKKIDWEKKIKDMMKNTLNGWYKPEYLPIS